MEAPVRPAPWKAPWTTMTPPAKPKLHPTTRRNRVPSSITSGSFTKTLMMPGAKVMAASPPEPKSIRSRATPAHATRRLRANCPAPRFCPTPVPTACPTAPEAVQIMDMTRFTMP